MNNNGYLNNSQAFNSQTLRGRGRRFRGGNRNAPVTTRYIRSLLSGADYLPTEVPPVVVSQPWNNVTIMFRLEVTSASTQNSFTVMKLKAYMLKQLGFAIATAEKVDFDFRIQSLAMWMIEPGHIVLFPYNFSDSTTAELSRIESHSMKNMYARVGYHYPSHLQSSTLSTRQNGTAELFGLALSAKSVVEMHIRILWKGADSQVGVQRTVFEYGDVLANPLKMGELDYNNPFIMETFDKQIRTLEAQLKRLDVDDPERSSIVDNLKQCNTIRQKCSNRRSDVSQTTEHDDIVFIHKSIKP